MEERATYSDGKPKPVTFRDLRCWLDSLRPDQLDEPALIVVDSGVMVVSALAVGGPVLLVCDLVRKEGQDG